MTRRPSLSQRQWRQLHGLVGLRCRLIQRPCKTVRARRPIRHFRPPSQRRAPRTRSDSRIDWPFGVVPSQDWWKQHRQPAGGEAVSRGTDLVDLPPSMSYDVAVWSNGGRLEPRPNRRHEKSFVLIVLSSVPLVAMASSPHARPNRYREARFFVKLASRGSLEALTVPQSPSRCYPPRINPVLYSLQQKQAAIVTDHQNSSDRTSTGRNFAHGTTPWRGLTALPISSFQRNRSTTRPYRPPAPEINAAGSCGVTSQRVCAYRTLESRTHNFNDLAYQNDRPPAAWACQAAASVADGVRVPLSVSIVVQRGCLFKV
jgi:hypothetical protein